MKNNFNSRFQFTLGRITLAILMSWARAAWANPEGMRVVQGSATATATPNQLNIQVSDRTFLSWSSFNIQPGEATRFIQPSAASIVVNQIGGANPSQIFGSLSANGTLILANPNGFYFGSGAMVKAANLAVTTAPLNPGDFNEPGPYRFNGATPGASIINYGQIQTAYGGSLYLIAEKIENQGSIDAPGGQIGLVAGQEVLLSERPDGRGLSIKVKLPEGTVDQAGRLTAQAGSILVSARTINQTGLIEADGVKEQNGVIELYASEKITLGEQSVTRANGPTGDTGAGGSIVIKSAGEYADAKGAQIQVAGGGQGGDGGQVDISASRMTAINSNIDGHAQSGSRGGELVIDPKNIVLASDGSGSAGNGTVNHDDPPDALRLNVNSAFVGMSHITLEAEQDIRLDKFTTWNLNDSTGISSAGCQLTLRAGNNIVLDNYSQLLAGDNWSISLYSGWNFGGQQTNPGVGDVLLNAQANLTSKNGNLHIEAGRNVTVTSGSITTLNGGSIEIIAQGNVDTGNNAAGYDFSTDGQGYSVSPSLGGVSTAQGGDVTIRAGGNIKSYLPTLVAEHQDAGTGAFGSEPGNVTIEAGGYVTGHYVLANGIGSITAGLDAGRETQQLALSLIKGSWDVSAPKGSINLQEVRNPNGVFNAFGSSLDANWHRFDYDPDASVTLNAGTVRLLGAALPRASSVEETSLGIFLPPTLNIHAGAGGILLNNNLTLMPSASGNLTLTTQDGGDLGILKSGTAFSITMSDSDKSQWGGPGSVIFGPLDHAVTPVHLNDDKLVDIEISGGINNLTLYLPKSFEVLVSKDMVNSSVVGQNLTKNSASLIEVGGNIINRSEFTLINVAYNPFIWNEDPTKTIFDMALDSTDPFSLLNRISRRLTYIDGTQQLAIEGRMTQSDLNALLNISIPRRDVWGNVIYDLSGNPTIEKVIPLCDPSILKALFAQSQDIPDGPQIGIKIGGGGSLAIRANNMDLGFAQGIISTGAIENSALGKYNLNGANIDLELKGNLSMFSSSIQSLSGGKIDINCQGSIDLGTQLTLGQSLYARGIFSVGKSDVNVTAGGDININGSRIATYGGGDLSIKSIDGNVNAGAGGVGYVNVPEVTVDKVTGETTVSLQPVPGSGIIAATLPQSPDPVGNVTVETPHGNINASAGGISQIGYNKVDASGKTITLSAGEKDADGKVTHVGNIDASNSGVVGQNIKMTATGDIKGLVVARQNIDIAAHESVNVSAMAQGNVSVAGTTVSGTVISGGSIDAKGTSIDAALMAKNVNASGDTSGASVGFAQTAAASTTSQAAQTKETEETQKTAANTEEEDNKKKSAKPALVKTTGRVTVILPKHS